MTNPDRDELDIVIGFELDRRRDAQIVQRCLALCSLFNMSGDDLVNSWLAYSFNHKIDDKVTMALLETLERSLHEENQKKLQKESLMTPKKSPLPLLRSRNTVSPMAVSQTQRLTSSFQSQLDAALSVKSNPSVKFSSPIPRARPQVSSAGFMSPSILGSPPAPSGPWAQRTNRGRVIQALNLDLDDFKPVSREDRANLSIQFDSRHWSANFLYMFQPEEDVDRLLEEREDSLLEEILTEQLEGQTLASLPPLNLASASEVIYGGSIWTYNSASKIHITDTWLRRHDQKVLLTLPTEDKAHWGFFPGMVCVLKGLNPTGNNMLVKEIFVPNISPSPSPMLANRSPAEVSIVFAAGPFTFNSDLAYSPLADLLEEVRRRAPTLLIISGPFYDIENETPTPKMFTEHREELWNFITERLQEVETRVITIPHIREAHHFPCFPQPSVTKMSHPKMDSKIIHLPNPCIFSIGHVKLCVMSHDIVFHLAGNEISKTVAGAQANRISRLCTYLLHQRSLYPLLLSPATASIDWTHISKFTLDSIPDIFLLPSQLGQYVTTAENRVFVNPGQLVKGAQSPGTFARIVAHPGSTPIHNRMRAEIVRI